MKSTKHLLLIIIALISLNVNAQEAVSLTVNVETAGTLPDLIPSSQKNQITNLTLTGNLNGTDIRFIREMAGLDFDGNSTEGKLSVLDLSKAQIVEGGAKYIIYSNVGYYSSLNSIGDYTFKGCKLTSVTIPNGVTSIGNNAFQSCTGLTSITIPESVTSIGSYAFQSCTGLTSITIPNSVTSIGHYTFSGCTGLTSITIPESVTSIGDVTFENCTGLTSVTIPNSVKEIGYGAFGGCTSLKEIIVSGNNPSYKSIEGVLCSKDGTRLIAYPYNKSNTYTIPNGVTSIGNYAFQRCIGLTSITIPNSVTSISNWAFENCTGLTSITIPESVTSIGYAAFSSCAGLTSVTIPNSVTSIGNYAFSGCSQIKQIYCKGTTPPKIDSKTFYDIYNICTLYVPKGAYSAYWINQYWGEFKNIIVEVTTSISDIDVNNINVYSENGSIIVKGGKLGDIIDIYSVSGSLLHKIKITDDIVRISVAPQSLYIVKDGNRSFKIAM